MVYSVRLPKGGTMKHIQINAIVLFGETYVDPVAPEGGHIGVKLSSHVFRNQSPVVTVTCAVDGFDAFAQRVVCADPAQEFSVKLLADIPDGKLLSDCQSSDITPTRLVI